MKKVMIIGVVLLVLACVGVFLTTRDTRTGVVEVPLLNNPTSGKSSEATEYGFTYQYRAGDDGYVVVTQEEAPRGNLVFVQSLFSKRAYEELLKSDVPREAPVGLTLGVYRNPMHVSAREWITQTDASNYKLSTDGTISETSLGSTEFLTYQFDGLYRADAYVYEKDGYIYFFTNMWENPESNMKKDMEDVLSSLTWSTPEVPAQVAHGDIVVSAPTYQEEIVSPLIIEGRARGNWYFEASFPVILVDWDGRIIAEGIAQAQDDWMTESLVPFKAELTFTKPSFDNRGSLILKKENPSGLPEHDDAIELPILYK